MLIDNRLLSMLMLLEDQIPLSKSCLYIGVNDSHRILMFGKYIKNGMCHLLQNIFFFQFHKR